MRNPDPEESWSTVTDFMTILESIDYIKFSNVADEIS